MNATYQTGMKVLFPLFGETCTGTIVCREWIGVELGYSITADGPKPGPWFVYSDDVSPIPNDVTILSRNTPVHVAADAPQRAGRPGWIEEPAIRDGMFGYWLYLASPTELAWVPAAALIPDGGGPR